MEYIEFGCNHAKASKVVLGLMRIPELDVQGIDALLNTAKDNGINFLDIAEQPYQVLHFEHRFAIVSAILPSSLFVSPLLDCTIAVRRSSDATSL